jgi:hypothetical protein
MQLKPCKRTGLANQSAWKSTSPDNKLPRIKQDPFIGNSTFIGIFIFTDNLFDADVVFFDEGLEFAMAKISFQSTLSNFVKTIAKGLIHLLTYEC